MVLEFFLLMICVQLYSIYLFFFYHFAILLVLYI